MDIKEEYILPDDVVSQNEREFCTMNRNSDDVTIKTEIKSETAFTKRVKHINCETATCSNNWDTHRKTEIEDQTLVSHFHSQNEGEFLPENPVMKYSVDHEIEIKEEPSWLDTETSTVFDGIKDEGFPPVKSSRLCTEAVSDDVGGSSALCSVAVSGRDIDPYNGKDDLDYEHQEIDAIELPTAEELVLSEQCGKSSDEGEMYIRPLYLKQKGLNPNGKSPHQCNTCYKSFTHLTNLKIHHFIHEGQRSHQCNTCGKSFILLSHLKTHNLIHEDKKPHQCKTCDKNFTQLSHLKRHKFMVHEGKKLYQCKTCSKSFTYLSHLKTHNLIHENKKPHRCKTCDKSFAQLYNLNVHNLIHEGKKPHQCKTCNKRFTQLSHLKTHNLIHEGRKPHQCKICDKSFTRLSHLKRHNLIHEGKKPYQCKTCDRSFAQLCNLKVHNLFHEGKKPHQCKICDRSFTLRSTLKKHNLVHEGKEPHKCQTCDKSFTYLSSLKRHNLIHERSSHNYTHNQ